MVGHACALNINLSEPMLCVSTPKLARDAHLGVISPCVGKLAFVLEASLIHQTDLTEKQAQGLICNASTHHELWHLPVLGTCLLKDFGPFPLRLSPRRTM